MRNKYYPVNEKIKDRKLRVISPDGKNLGIMERDAALEAAKSKNLDLVVVSAGSKPSVARILDFSKFLYDKNKQISAEKKSAKNQKEKILRIGTHIDENDLRVKIERAKEFLNNNRPVRFELFFRGREIAHPEIGEEKFTKLKEALSEESQVIKELQRKGRIMSMTLAPK